MNEAIENVSAAVEEATASAQDISDKTNETSVAVEDVAKLAQEQAGNAENLLTQVSVFTIENVVTSNVSNTSVKPSQVGKVTRIQKKTSDEYDVQERVYKVN